jgi:glycosyl hydrolase family 26
VVVGERGNAPPGGTTSRAGRKPTREARARGMRHRLHAVLVTALLTAGTAVPCAAHAAVPGDVLGVYAGSGNTSAVTAFGDRLGRRLTFAHDFLNKDTWSSVTDMSWLAGRWRDAGYTERLVLTVPMLPDSGGTLAAGAAGDYNHNFRTLAESLVAQGQGSAVLRIGPEFNGNWHLWTINVPDGGALYAAYWRQIVTTMRSVQGAHFKFDWCASNGSSWTTDEQQLEAETAWPGDAYVDYVGLDVYDQSWAPWQGDPVARWNEYLNLKNGLRWHAAFAAAHGKQMTFPEWGLADRADGHGGGDNPYFIEQMYWWIQSHDVAYALYFESHDPNGEYGIFSGHFPQAAQRFVEYFGPTGPPVSPADAAGGRSTLARAGAAGAGRSAGGGRRAVAQAAKLSISRARLLQRRRRFELLAPISRRASGAATVTLQAGGVRTRFSAPVDSDHGRIALRRRVPARQARTGTGIVTIDYKGDADTQPSAVRLRAAPHPARLRARRPRIAHGRLRARGTIARRAHGVVRIQLVYTAGAQRVVRELTAPIHRGRWRLDRALSPDTVAGIDQRDGTLHAYTLFTGYLPARMRGEMRSAQVLGQR